MLCGPEELCVIRNPYYTLTIIFEKFNNTKEIVHIVHIVNCSNDTFQSINLHSWKIIANDIA